MTSELQKPQILQTESLERACIEAALYSSGRALTPHELAKAAGLTSKRRAISHARSLTKIVGTSFDAIEVIELNDGRFAMQLKKDFYEVAKKFASRQLLSRSSLRTLSYVAYFQPVTALQLARKLGSRVYMNLKKIEDLGFVVSERSNRTKSYRTTRIFSEYFGLEYPPEELKKHLSSRVPEISGAK